MPEPPRSGDAVLELVRRGELADDDVLKSFVLQSGPLPVSADDTATRLVQSGILTSFQARLILQGKHKGFRLGPYRILDQIGVGGMGQVYLAEHVHLHREVALKVLPGKLASDKIWVERFYREARAVAALDHPNVVRAYDVACEKGTHFLVMQFIRGKPLSEILQEAGGCLPVAEACDYVVQAALGLQHAHDKGIAHRDIKPANLLVDARGFVKILDMGLAKFFQDCRPCAVETLEPNVVMGTADYIAPEQAVGCLQADHRADIYSLGATLYHLVTGEPPFHGPTSAKLIAHQLQQVPRAHDIRQDVPEGISEVIARMMAKEPSQRYQTAAEVVQELMPFAAESTHVAATPSGRLVPVELTVEARATPGPTHRGEKLLVMVLVAAILVLSGVIALILVLLND
jgi:serine/threonine-protein kinase